MSFTDMIAAEQDMTTAAKKAKQAARELDTRMRRALLEQLRPMIDDFNDARMVFTQTPAGMTSTAKVHNRCFIGKPAYLVIRELCDGARLTLVCPVPEAMQVSPGTPATDLDEADMDNIVRDIICGKTPELLFSPTMSKDLLEVTMSSTEGGYVYLVKEGGYGEKPQAIRDPAEASKLVAKRLAPYVGVP